VVYPLPFSPFFPFPFSSDQWEQSMVRSCVAGRASIAVFSLLPFSSFSFSLWRCVLGTGGKAGSKHLFPSVLLFSLLFPPFFQSSIEIDDSVDVAFVTFSPSSPSPPPFFFPLSPPPFFCAVESRIVIKNSYPQPSSPFFFFPLPFFPPFFFPLLFL